MQLKVNIFHFLIIEPVLLDLIQQNTNILINFYISLGESELFFEVFVQSF
jgi:hypothetical protein